MFQNFNSRQQTADSALLVSSWSLLELVGELEEAGVEGGGAPHAVRQEGPQLRLAWGSPTAAMGETSKQLKGIITQKLPNFLF